MIFTQLTYIRLFEKTFYLNLIKLNKKIKKNI